MRRPYAVAFSVLMLMVLAVFWRHVFTSDVPFFRDVAGEHFPRSMELRALVRSGNLPLWNPYEHCGEAVASNPIYLLFYPTAWLAWILPPVFGFKLHYVLHFFLLAAGGFSLARRMDLRPVSCWFAGALWVFSGPAMSLGNFYNMLPAVAWMPWVILAADYLMRQGGWRGTGVFAGAVAMQVLTAEPTSLLSSLVLALGWCVAKYGDFRSPLRSPTNNALVGRFLAAGFLSIAFAAAQIVPAVIHLTTTPRGSNLTFAHSGFWSLHPLKLLEILVPEIWGNWMTYTGGLPWIYLDGREPFLLSVFVGIVPLALAAVAVLTVKDRMVRFWALAAILGLLVAMGRFTPLFSFFYNVIPIFRVLRFPVKALLAPTLAVAMLAAVGCEYLLSGEDEARASRRLRWLSRTLFAFGILWLAASIGVFTEPAKKLVLDLVQSHFTLLEKHRMLLLLEMNSEEIVNRAAGWIIVALPRLAFFVWFSVVLVGALLYRGRWALTAQMRRVLLLVAVLSSVAIPTLVHSSLNMVVSHRFYDDEPPVLRYLTGPAPVRIFAQPTFRMTNSLLSLTPSPPVLDFLPPPAQVLYAYRMDLSIGATVLGLESSFANDPQALLPEPLAQLNWLIYETHMAGMPLTRLLQMSSVQYAMFTVPLPAPGLVPVGTAANGTKKPVTAYRVPDSLPRAYLAEDATVLKAGPATINELVVNDFDLRRQIMLDDPTRSEGTRIQLGSDPERQATVLSREPMRVEVETSSAQPSFLVLTDSYDPGWQATVDGQPARIVRANQIFRSVELPAGRHRIVFRYVPVWLYLGVAVSLLSIAITAVIALRQHQPRPLP